MIVMAGLVPAIHVLQTFHMQGGWVYILTNRPNGVLYTLVTRDIARRAWQHRDRKSGMLHTTLWRESGSSGPSITMQS